MRFDYFFISAQHHNFSKISIHLEKLNTFQNIAFLFPLMYGLSRKYRMVIQNKAMYTCFRLIKIKFNLIKFNKFNKN